MKTEATNSPSTPAAKRTPMWAFVVATCFGIGTLGPGPGTWASAYAVVVWWAMSHGVSPSHQAIVLFAMSALVVAIGIPAATRVARGLGTKDPGLVVIDEVAGQWITLLFAPVTWKTLLMGFILFRAFDILKPPPVRQLERLPEGTGIVIDDLGAGLYGLLVMQLVLHFRLLSP